MHWQAVAPAAAAAAMAVADAFVVVCCLLPSSEFWAFFQKPLSEVHTNF
jgi:hypothetical protein